MTIQNIALFQAMGAKMGYLNTRQGLIANNIANADTPEYRPRDLTKVDFGAVLKDVTGTRKIHVNQTREGHMIPGGDIDNPRDRKVRMTYEVAPADNAVIIEEQMVEATKTTMDYNLMTSLMRKNVGLIRTALGQGGR